MSVLNIGASVKSSYEAFQEFDRQIKSKISIEIDNYARWALAAPDHKILKGKTLTSPHRVNPAYTEGFSAQGDFDGTEGISAWTTKSGQYCFYYWYVDGNYPERTPNSFAAGCRSTNESKSIDDIVKEIEGIKEQDNPVYKTDDYVYSRYDGDICTEQFCSADRSICVHISMSSHYQCEADIAFYPTEILNYAPSLRNSTSQDELDKILDPQNHHKLNCSSEKGNYLEGSWVIYTVITIVVGVFGFIGITICVAKKCRNS